MSATDQLEQEIAGWVADVLGIPDDRVKLVTRDTAAVTIPPERPFAIVDIGDGPRMLNTAAVIHTAAATIYRQPGEWTVNLRIFGPGALDLVTVVQMLASNAQLTFTIEPLSEPMNISGPVENAAETIYTVDLTARAYLQLELPPGVPFTGFDVGGGGLTSAPGAAILPLSFEVNP